MKNGKKDDIQSDEQSLAHSQYIGINWVGMSKIQSFIAIQDRNTPVELDMYVNLLPGHRGIHMSRLYQLQMENLLGNKLSVDLIRNLLAQSITSQEGLATHARMKISYQELLNTKSLKSHLPGFRSYPIEVMAESDQNQLQKMNVKFVITYSSTCPQSAKLSKEMFKKNQMTSTELQQWYDSDQIFPATPHAQRSHMTVELSLGSQTELDVPNWVRQIEDCLQTNVQTAVKKSDEMEFARLNAENTMFCEDAVRKVAQFLDSSSFAKGYKLTAEHFESLHPHNATSQIIKNFQL